MPPISLSGELVARGGGVLAVAGSGDLPLVGLLAGRMAQMDGIRAVTLHLADPLKLVRALIALDGRVGRIVLTSGDTPLREAVSIHTAAGGEAIVTDSRELLAAGASMIVRWTTDAEPLSQAPSSDVDEPSLATEWVFATSGTTGVPKLVAHRLVDLLRAIKRGDRRSLRWGLLFDGARFAGAQVMLQGLLGGEALLLPRRDGPLQQTVSFLRERNCTALSATPTMWRKLLMTPGSERLTLRQITLGGEIADGPLLSGLAARYPDARITHIYASTEVGAAFPVHDGLPGFPSAYLDAQPGRPAIQVRDGRLHVRKDHGARCYLGTGAAISGADGFVDTGDMVRREGDRYLFLGRANGSINVGGNKLYPEEVEAMLLRHPAVSAARVYGKKNPVMGELVAAELVRTDEDVEPSGLMRDIRRHCEAHLDRWKVPAVIHFVSGIETAASGKIERRIA